MFFLSKWYCDCVTEGGDAFIGYRAQLDAGPFSIPYASTILRRANEPAARRVSFRRSPAPAVDDRNVHWTCTPLHVDGRWTAHGKPYARTLYASPKGSISWHCLVPCGRAEVDIGNGGHVGGLGYAEHLAMSVKPWRLPITELRWGRFLAPDNAVTWIAWHGPERRNWVFHNGEQIDGATINTHRVVLRHGAGVLDLRDATVLQEGNVGATAFPSARGLRLLLPRWLRTTHEVKWLARGTFTTTGHKSTGWAIHEVVRWR